MNMQSIYLTRKYIWQIMVSTEAWLGQYTLKETSSEGHAVVM